jgi:hypothetical protein
MRRKIELITNPDGSLSVKTNDPLAALANLDIDALTDATKQIEAVKVTANKGVADAAAAKSVADTAKTTATAAQTTANTANTTANTAKSTADTAKTTADKGVADAATAKTTADKGVTDSAAAKASVTTLDGKVTAIDNRLKLVEAK